MLRAEAEAGADARPHDDRRRVRTAREIADLGRLGHHHVESDAEELDEHDLDDRPQSRGGRTNGGAAEPHLGDRRVPHAHRAELVEQTFGGLERTPPRRRCPRPSRSPSDRGASPPQAPERSTVACVASPLLLPIALRTARATCRCTFGNVTTEVDVGRKTKALLVSPQLSSGVRQTVELATGQGVPAASPPRSPTLAGQQGHVRPNSPPCSTSRSGH